MQTQQIYKHVMNNDRITSHVGRYEGHINASILHADSVKF